MAEEVSDAIYRLLLCLAAADRTVEMTKDSEYERVHEARRDTAERVEMYSLDNAIDEGIRRYEERGTEEKGGEDVDDGPDEEGQLGVVDQRQAKPEGILRGQGVDGHQGQREA